MAASEGTGRVAHERAFRHTLGHFPTGVVAVTAIDADGRPTGMAVGSFTSVSLDPPLVGFLADRSSSTFPKIRAAERFCVNVLSAHQLDVCRHLAARSDDKFAEIDWSTSPSGQPVIAGAVAWIDCEIDQVVPAGDHLLTIGRVVDLRVENGHAPLVFFQGGYGSFTADGVAAPTLVARPA